MNHKKIVPLLIASTLLLQPCVQASADPVNSFSEMLSEGDVSLSFRYRYEFVDQDGIDKTANASTLKTRLNFTSAPYQGFTSVLEMDNVTVIGDERYRTPSNGQTDYPIVADPDGTDVNQAFVAYKNTDYSATAGRQRILHGSQRFVGGVGWRQNEQTYDAFRFSSAAVGPLSIDYSYVWNVNRIFGPDNSAAQAKQWDSDSHILFASYALAEAHTLNGFAYLLDFDDSPANSTSTYGIEYKGKFSMASVTASYATQSDYGDNSASFDTNYLMAEVSLPIKSVILTAGYELLGSDNGVGFKTPLATLHKFQGWADKFLTTPGLGVEDSYLKVATKVADVNVAATYHDFSSNEGGEDYGSELDMVASYAFNKNVNAQLKYAAYSADTFATDTVVV